jgi:hypothetical protein
MERTLLLGGLSITRRMAIRLGVRTSSVPLHALRAQKHLGHTKNITLRGFYPDISRQNRRASDLRIEAALLLVLLLRLFRREPLGDRNLRPKLRRRDGEAIGELEDAVKGYGLLRPLDPSYLIPMIARPLRELLLREPPGKS